MSTRVLGLSDACTLILPVPLESLGEVAASAAASLGEILLVRKKEHHLTVFGYPIGKALKKAIAAEPALRAEIDAAIAAFDWTVKIGRGLVHLERANPSGVLHTVIVRAEADLAGFFARVHALVVERTPDQTVLSTLLETAPPPHVTLYTSDPAGAAGIGLTSEAELAAALARAGSGEAGLVARALADGDLVTALG